MRSARVALCGIAAALATVCLLLTVVPVSELALPALAGLMLTPIVVELGRRYALTVYGAVCLLALLLVPAWEPKLLFIGFFGYYPILKASVERLRRPIIEWTIKLAVFNVAVVAVYWVLLSFFSLDPSEFVIGGYNLMWLFLPVANGVFFLYDIGLTQVISNYIRRFSPQLRRLFRF